MALYRVGVTGATPLRIQLGTSPTAVAEIVLISACGDNATGSASRPQITYPSTPGAGSGTIQALNAMSPASTCTAITSFSSAPSTPVVGVVANLPIRILTRMPRGSGFVVPVSSYALLYAAASGGHTWTSEIQFEEF